MYEIPTNTYPVNYWTAPIRTKRELCALDVVDATCGAFNVSKEMLLSHRRFTKLVRARYICMYVIRLKVKIGEKQMSVKRIGNIFHIDHTTVLHGLGVILSDLKIMAYRQETNEQINSVINLLQ